MRAAPTKPTRQTSDDLRRDASGDAGGDEEGRRGRAPRRRRTARAATAATGDFLMAHWLVVVLGAVAASGDGPQRPLLGWPAGVACRRRAALPAAGRPIIHNFKIIYDFAIDDFDLMKSSEHDFALRTLVF